MDIKTAKRIFDAHNGIMKTKEIQDNKIYSHYLVNLVKNGYVERIRHGYYQWQDARAFSEAATIARLFPDAVLCNITVILTELR